jgi:FKBP-type peptidyl-prolyl cis-trans isomerase FkpA
MKKLYLFGLFTTLFLASCSSYSDHELDEFDREIQTYLREKGIHNAERTETGLYYSILEQGDGRSIPVDAIISCRYKGYLTNGRPFDSQLGEPVDLRLKQLIPGWREAMMYMHVGTRAHLFIPPQLGYKNQQKGEIPENSVLIFDIEIIDVK